MEAQMHTNVEPPDIAADMFDASRDRTNTAVGLGAVVHKHPFAPTCVEEEPTHNNVFQQPSEKSGKHHCSLSSGKAVRVFIGPTDTDWMQKHQRWWARTASKLEVTTAVGNKIHRKTSALEKTKDRTSDIFSKSRRQKKALASRRSSSSLSSLSATDSSSSDGSGDQRYPDENDSEWSLHSERAVVVPTPAIESYNIAPNSHISSTIANSGDSTTLSHSNHSSNQNIAPARNSIPMPELNSPLLDQPSTIPAQPSTAVKSPADQSSHHTRRKSSLNTIKGIFRRSSRKREAEKPNAQAQDTSNNAVADDKNPVFLKAQPSRERAISLSHLPSVHELPWSPMRKAVEPRNSLDSNIESSKLPLIKRGTLQNRNRSVTWQTDLRGAENVTPTVAPDLPTTTMTIPQADIYLQQMLVANRSTFGGVSVSSSKFGPKRAMLAKVKGYYHRHAQLSETTAILSTRAVVRRETASYAAFSEKYNEATSQRFRQTSQEWLEMWVALTKRGIMFYLTSKTRPAVQVLFPPHTVVAPRVSLYSTLDLSLAITYYTRRDSISTPSKDQTSKSMTGGIVSEDTETGRDNVRVVIIKFPSPQIACDWYREIGQVLMVCRVMNPQCLFSSIPPIAQPPPASVLVNVPEIGIKVQVRLGRHNIEVPMNILLGGAEDSLLERQWRCETTTVWHVRRDVVNVLLKDKVIGPQMQEWLDAEREGMITIGMAWRRYDRLDWILPCGSLDKRGDFYTSKVNDKVIGPQLSEGTHRLEMRILEHYPDSVVIDDTRVYEPLAVEGFLMLKREKKRRTEITTYRPALLASHDGFLFFIHAPHAARHMQACASECFSPPVRVESNANGYFQRGGGVDLHAVRHFHPDPRICSKQMSLAKYMLSIVEIDQIVPLMSDPDDEVGPDGQPNDTLSVLDADSQSTASGRPQTSSSASSNRKKNRGKVLEFLRSKKSKQAVCKFKMVTRGGATIILWAPDERCMNEWVRRLNELRVYWTNRMLLDLSIRSQVGVLNYSLQGRRYRVNDKPDGNDEQSWADRAVWHACLFLGCRNIIMSGVLYRKRHRHQGMRKVFCIVAQGRLIEYKFPRVPLASNQSALAEQTIRRDTLMSRLFDGDINGTSSADANASGSNPGNQATGLLFSRSRSLSLRRCYVVSRFTDDLNSSDITCEPWVMTDIGNYSGLRLADRVYADGIVSHELINDCVFTVWRPTFVPSILRTDNNPETMEIANDYLRSSGEISDGERSARAAELAAKTEGAKDSDAINSRPSITFSPPPEPTDQCNGVAPNAIDGRYASHQRNGSGDTFRASNEGIRISTDGYMSSVSNASSNWSNRGPGSAKPGAYRVGDKIHVNVDEKNDNTKRINAVTMVSSMRRRVGVYKARSSAEMEQWVTAINQEIRRMSLTEEW